MIRRVLPSLAGLVMAAGCATAQPDKGPAVPIGSQTAEVTIDDAAGTPRTERDAYDSRVHQAVSKTWHPLEAYDRHDPDRKHFGVRDRHVLVIVTIDAAGQIKKIVVARSSGLHFIDESAVDAFREAQPFPRPPAEILDESGELRSTFRFHVRMTRG